MRSVTLRQSICFGLMVGLGLAGSNPCAAQTEAKKPLTKILVFETKIKPDMVTEWESLQKNEVNPALKKAGIPFRYVWEGWILGEGYTWVSVVPLTNFAMFDQEHPYIRALGKEAGQALMEKLRKCTVASHGYAMNMREDLSLMKDTKDMPVFAQITTVRVAQGRRMDYEDLLKNHVVPALRKAEVANYWIHETLFGGDVNEWVSVMPMEKLRDLDQDLPLVRALGRDGMTELSRKSAGIIVSLQRTVAKRRDDLSYMSAEAAGVE